MKVCVIGKEHAEGTSKKTGNPFSNTVVHVSYKKNRVEGQAVEAIWLDAKSFPLDAIQVGKTYAFSQILFSLGRFLCWLGRMCKASAYLVRGY